MWADMKVEDILAENGGGSGVELRLDARNAYDQLQIAMKSSCIVQGVPFQVLLQAVQQSDEIISNFVPCFDLRPIV